MQQIEVADGIFVQIPQIIEGRPAIYKMRWMARLTTNLIDVLKPFQKMEYVEINPDYILRINAICLFLAEKISINYGVREKNSFDEEMNEIFSGNFLDYAFNECQKKMFPTLKFKY